MEAPKQESTIAVLVQINKELHRLQANTTDPDTRLNVLDLCRRTQQCLAAGGHPKEVFGIKIKFNELIYPVNMEASYPVFIRRLRNIDAGNLLDRYLPSSEWFSRESQKRYGGKNDQHSCGDAEYHDRRDCPQTIPLTDLYEAFNGEHDMQQLWLTRIIGFPHRIIRPYQPASPWSNYLKKVALWSNKNQSPEEAWDFTRIVECLRENYERAHNYQDPYQKFLDYGLDYTVARLVQDSHARVSERIVNEVEGFKKDLLFGAIARAREYYFADDSLEPLDWVKHALTIGGGRRTPRKALGPVQNITKTWDWPDIHEEAEGRVVTVSCLHEDTGDIWHQHVLGIDNGFNEELDASLCNNRANKAEYEAKFAVNEQPSTTEGGNCEEDKGYEADDEDEEDKGDDISPDEKSEASPQDTEVADGSETEHPSSSQPQEVRELDDGDDGFSGGSRQLFAEFNHHQRDVDRFNSRVRYEADSEDEDEDSPDWDGFQSSSEGSDSDSDSD